MIREPLRRRGRQHQGVTRLAATKRPGRTAVTVSEQVADGNGHSALAVELARLRADNARLLRLLNLTRQEAALPGPWQSGLFDASPGLVHADSPPEAKVALFRAHGFPPQAVVISKMLSLPARTSASWWLVMCHQGYGVFAGLSW